MATAVTAVVLNATAAVLIVTAAALIVLGAVLIEAAAARRVGMASKHVRCAALCLGSLGKVDPSEAAVGRFSDFALKWLTCPGLSAVS
jgi:hypothetical protein